VFTGVSGIRLKKSEAVDAAIEDAARRLSLFHSVTGIIEQSVNQGGGIFDYHSQRKASLIYDTDLEKYKAMLDFDPETGVYEADGVVFIRAVYTAANRFPVGKGHSSGGEQPAWVDNPPAEVAGFRAGVGYAGQRSLHKDTIVASYDTAVFSILESLSQEIKSLEESSQSSAGIFNQRSRSSSESASSGTLQGFSILESWTDPHTKAVWTLAVISPPEVFWATRLTLFCVFC
jgi:hypothetical protein